MFFRRPFSIAGILGNKIELIFKVVGEGTKWLSTRKPGSKLDILGPLGNGFNLTSSETLLVAGGSGIASLAFLAKRINPGILFYGRRFFGIQGVNYGFGGRVSI
jgi:dihydroorotate dehydrogenase electron transfer subunit